MNLPDFVLARNEIFPVRIQETYYLVVPSRFSKFLDELCIQSARAIVEYKHWFEFMLNGINDEWMGQYRSTERLTARSSRDFLKKK